MAMPLMPGDFGIPFHPASKSFYDRLRSSVLKINLQGVVSFLNHIFPTTDSINSNNLHSTHAVVWVALAGEARFSNTTVIKTFLSLGQTTADSSDLRASDNAMNQIEMSSFGSHVSR